MREVCILASEEEIRNAIGCLWRTEEFKASHHRGWIRSIVDQVVSWPIAVYQMDRPEIEMSHNLAWMRFLALRDYESPGISDLYYLRQLSYMAQMRYLPEQPWTHWYGKMAECAFNADFDSEVRVYVNLPSFREQTFPFDIWVDRFNFRLRSLGEIRERRLQAIRSPDPFDFIEAQLHSFYRQNLVWAKIWQRRFRQVEHRMSEFTDTAGLDRTVAMVELTRWLQEDVIVVPGLTVPFHIEAELFADHWQEQQHLYGNAILRL